MKHLLVKASIDYADEFNCETFGVFTDKEWNDLCAEVKTAFKNLDNEEEEENDEEEPDESWADTKEVEVYFGTNECLTFDSYKDWLANFAVKEITATEAKFLENNFGHTFGTGSDIFDIADRINELN